MEETGTNDRYWHWTQGNSSAEGTMEPGDFIVTNKYTTYLPNFTFHKEPPKRDMDDGHG